MMSEISENIRRISFEIEEAKAKYRKSDEHIDIMAVTKTVEPERVNEAIECGLSLLGENRVQEYISKKDFYDKSADVHFIGSLQTNKVKYIIDSVSLIQSVDSLKLANEIDRQAKKHNLVMNILLEVNIGEEITKGGFAPQALDENIFEISKLENVRICGLMTIPPPNCEKFLYKMQKLFIDKKAKKYDNVTMDILSMGMSGDYVEAVKYGSNIVRLGTAIFGKRNYPI